MDISFDMYDVLNVTFSLNYFIKVIIKKVSFSRRESEDKWSISDINYKVALYNFSSIFRLNNGSLYAKRTRLVTRSL